MSDLVERLKRNAEWRNERWETITDPALLLEAAAEIESLRASLKRVQSAAKTIMIGEADELRRLREGAKEAHLAKLTLDSEREANARLTEELARTERNREMWKDQCERQAGELATLRTALSKITPIRVHDGPDYAEVFFADGKTHSTQAMTMNPQDWRDLQDVLANWSGEASQ